MLKTPRTASYLTEHAPEGQSRKHSKGAIGTFDLDQVGNFTGASKYRKSYNNPFYSRQLLSVSRYDLLSTILSNMLKDADILSLCRA